VNKLIRKLLMKLGGSFATRWIREVAEGYRHHWLGRVYWWLAGKKRWISLALGLTAGALVQIGEPKAAAMVGTVAAVLFLLGFVDKSWRTVEIPPALRESWWWKLLAHNSPTLAIAFAAGRQWLAGPSCSVAAQVCTWGSYAVAFLAAVAVQAGLMDAAWRSKAPNLDGGPLDRRKKPRH
jgi:hypothetical protein